MTSAAQQIDPQFEMQAAAQLYDQYLAVSRAAFVTGRDEPEFIAPLPAPLTLTFS